VTRIPVAATKSNLLRLRADLVFLRAGRDLLEQKREFLADALLAMEREARALREQVETALAAAWDQLAEAHADHGAAGLDRLALAAAPLAPVTLHERSLMGVVVPLVQAPVDETGAPAGLRATAGISGGAADATASALRGLAPRLLELAELDASCLRIARELASTRRKLNALEVVHVPAHEETIRFLADQLEEREREALFQLKRVRALEEGDR
jgi:V/A-type H+-transporting ATPase subunit D